MNPTMADSTLLTLVPALPFWVGGERVMLRPVILGELDQVGRVVDAWKVLVASGGKVLDAEGWEEFLRLLVAAVDKPMAWLEALNEDAFEHLVALVLAINEEVWKPAEGPDSDEELSWETILQCLIEHGHTFEAIKGYTLAQARGFLAQGFKREREQMAQRIQAAAFAMADGKSVQKVVKELRRG